MALLGASGSGKSSLLNLLAGLDSPSAGTVIVEDQSLSGLSREQLANADVDGGQQEVERNGRGQAHRRANQSDADLVGNLRGLHLLALTDPSESRHHAQHRSEQAEQECLQDPCWSRQRQRSDRKKA